MEMKEEENKGIEGKVVAVTGGLGLVGSTVCLELLRRGALQVRSFDCRTTSPWSDNLKESGVHCIHGDVVSREDVEEALQGVDLVIHLASYGGSGKEMIRTHRIEEVNVEGTRNVLETCVKKGITRLVYLSTNGVVSGGKELENGDETLPYVPYNNYVSSYDRTKSIAEQLVLENNGRVVENGRGSLLSTCAIRCPIVYGPAEEKYLDRIISDARLGLFLFKIGDASSKTDFIYVDNIVYALMLATADLLNQHSKAAGKAYIVSDGNPINFFEFLRPLLMNLDYELPKSSLSIPVAVLLGKICEAIYTMLSPLLNQGWIPQPLILPPEVYKVGVTHYYSIRKAKEELGYEPTTQPEEAMTKTNSYFKDKKRREVDGPSIYAWIFCVIGLPSIISVAWLPDIGPIPFFRVIALFIFRSMLVLRIASGIVVTTHVSEAVYALWLARRVDPKNAKAWFWRTLLLATFSLRLLLKRAKEAKQSTLREGLLTISGSSVA
ncbi:short-chain dehydrogenase/reductase family 42E member 1 [Capsella rubella]|nr:short-chain dehydrogenase/reductase family 42E member 1 [Capsella rubella]